MKHQINGAGGVLVITLHQPGSEVSALVDDLLLLGYGGHPVFMGPWGAAMHYFTSHLGLALPPHTGLADWLLALLDKEAHRQQQQQQQHRHKHQLCSSRGGSSGGFTSLSGSISADSRSSSLNISGGGCSKNGILLHACSGSSSSGCSEAPPVGPLSSMAAAWKRYTASGRAAAAAAPYYVAADSACLLAAGLNPHDLSVLSSQLPGLSEITEASSDDDADIIITTIVVDAAEQSTASLSHVPSVSQSSRKSFAVAAAPGARGPRRGVASASLAVQVRVLAGRAFRWWIRNPAMLLSGERTRWRCMS